MKKLILITSVLLSFACITSLHNTKAAENPKTVAAYQGSTGTTNPIVNQINNEIEHIDRQIADYNKRKPWDYLAQIIILEISKAAKQLELKTYLQTGITVRKA